MSNYVNIPLGLKTTTQVPLNIKEFAGSEVLLKDLGLDNNLAFTYHKDLEITCLEEGTKWKWREVQIGEENTGLLDVDFTYPPNLIAFGVDYSNKTYNFFPANNVSSISPLEKIDEGNGEGIIIRNRISENYGSIGLNAVDLSFSDDISSTRGATGENSFSVGLNNTSSNQGTFTAGSNNTANQANAIALGDSNTASNPSCIALGNFSTASGNYSVAIGNGVKARSWGETAVGNYNTDYTPLDTSGKNPLDRAFVVGNGGASFFPSDAFIILKNGLATLPSVTNALITADTTGKAIITKEYLAANSGGIDSTALHKTGDESFTGVKSSTNTGSGITTGFSLTNNGIAGSTVLNIFNSGAGAGELITNSSSGDGIRIVNNSSGKSIYISLNSTSTGITVNNTGTGLSYIGQNNAVTTFTIDKLGNINANSFIKTGGTASQYLMADGNTRELNPQSVVTTSYTLTAADNNSVIFLNNSAPITITVPVSGLPDNFNVGFVQETANDVTYTGSGISNPIGLKGKGQGYQQIIERKLNTSTYYLLGNTKA